MAKRPSKPPKVPKPAEPVMPGHRFAPVRVGRLADLGDTDGTRTAPVPARVDLLNIREDE